MIDRATIEQFWYVELSKESPMHITFHLFLQGCIFNFDFIKLTWISTAFLYFSTFFSAKYYFPGNYFEDCGDE